MVFIAHLNKRIKSASFTEKNNEAAIRRSLDDLQYVLGALRFHINVSKWDDSMNLSYQSSGLN